jgi:hypothetical protein
MKSSNEMIFSDASGKTGNCQMLTGNIHKTDAHLSNDNTSICGLIPVSWHGNSWAISCSFEGNDLSQVVTPGDFCTTECDSTYGKKTKAQKLGLSLLF